jgi:hypothetical protein
MSFRRCSGGGGDIACRRSWNNNGLATGRTFEPFPGLHRVGDKLLPAIANNGGPLWIVRQTRVRRHEFTSIKSNRQVDRDFPEEFVSNAAHTVGAESTLIGSVKPRFSLSSSDFEMSLRLCFVARTTPRSAASLTTRRVVPKIVRFLPPILGRLIRSRSLKPHSAITYEFSARGACAERRMIFRVTATLIGPLMVLPRKD